MNLFALIFLLCFILFSDAVFQRCEEISVSLFDSQKNVSMSAIFHVSRNKNDKNDITYKQFTQSGITNLELNHANILSNIALPQINISLCVNTEKQCFKNSTDIITVDDGTFKIAAIFGSDFDYFYSLFWGSMNEANFIFYDGSMFSDSNKCLKYSDIDMNLLAEQPFWQYTTCCTSFQPVITAAELPKCTNFNISSTLFNITDNNIVATTASNFVLSENDIIGTGRFSLNYSPFEYEFLYAINSMPCQWSSTNFQYCHYPINREDKTLWFYVRQEPTIYPLAIAGKLIIRNGQTLMAEGMPFSIQNMCQNFTQPLHMREIYGGDILNWTVNVLSQFCCTKFESSNPISSPSTIISSKNITEQKCNGIQTSAIYKTLNINMSAALDVSSFNDTINSINVKNFKIDTSLNQSNFQFCTDEFIYVGLQNCRKISSSMNFSVNNSPLKLTLSTHLLNNGYAEYRPALFNGMIDHGSFVSFDGSLFDMNKQKCSTFNHDELSVTSCCTSFNQTISLNSVNHPRCKNFHATSTLYNISDNNSIYVTASANFVISDTDIIAIGDFTQFSAPLYSINGFRFEFGVNGTQFGGFPLKSLNSEFLIHLSFYQNSVNHDSIYV